MIPFFKQVFSWRRKASVKANGMLDLNLGKDAKPRQRHTEADVHQLMIKATSIRKDKGYGAAIEFLKQLSEEYLAEQNTALVSCQNKLIPYMKRDASVAYEEIRTYLEDVIRRSPVHEPYFRNLHLIMIDLIKEEDPAESLTYIARNSHTIQPDMVDFDMLIKAADLYIDLRNEAEARKKLSDAADLNLPFSDRFQQIKKRRKWHRSYARLFWLKEDREGASGFLFHRFMEFALDMARVLDPMQIEAFHQRKDLYFKKERGFEQSEGFEKAIRLLDLEEKQPALLREVYGFVFEEMPMMLNLTKNQLYFQPGEKETLSELQEKKQFVQRAFTQETLIEESLRQILKKYYW